MDTRRTNNRSPARTVGAIDGPLTRATAHAVASGGTAPGGGPLALSLSITASRVPDDPTPRHPEASSCVSPACSPPVLDVTAHCDLPCGVYDPAQARIEAESVKAIQEKYQGNEDPVFRSRAILIKEQRAELVKHHLWVLWTDYFKPPHFEKYPELHELFNKATKQAGASGGKGSMDPAEGQKLLDLIAEIDKIFWETKAAA